jgi:hypothetical protein
MTDFHTRLQKLRDDPTSQMVEIVYPLSWNKIAGNIDRNAWWPVTRAVSPQGINVTILENVNE